MDITLIEARELYRQGGLAKEVALRAFPEEEIVNDYTLMVALPTSLPANCSDLYSKLSVVYKFMSRGRKVELTSGLYYVPVIVLARPSSKPNHGTYAGKIMIDDQMFNVYIDTVKTMWEGRLGFENDDVCCGYGLLSNHWIFKEREQAEHFVEHFYKELITLDLEEFHTFKFV